MSHYLLEHARYVIGAHLDRRPWRVSGHEEQNGPAQGCFVSLKTVAGDRLRGCIGTLLPVHDTILEEVAENALAAALRDPRFRPVRPEELGGLRISIDLLGPLERVAGMESLDPAHYGVVVRAGSRSGVLLPAIPGIDSVALQVSVCREKAGIAEREAVTLERFTVRRLFE